MRGRSVANREVVVTVFWIVLGVVVGGGALLAWWLSGPRFSKPPHEALPPSHDSPGLPFPGGSNGRRPGV